MPILIPYAADAVTAGQVSFGDDGTPAAYRLPAVAVEPGRALRLNSGGLELGEPPPLAAMPEVADQLAFLSGHFRHQCGVWTKYARRFVERYMDFVAWEVAAHRDELARQLDRFGDLYRVEHWAFSALRPLPRAHLPAPEMPEDAPPDSLVKVDVAFWTGSGAVAVELVGRTTRGAAEAHRRARLEAAGTRVVGMQHDLLDDDDMAAFAALLPADFRTFWRGEALPSGPFGTDTVPDALPDLP